jgi:hypothetical protein
MLLMTAKHRLCRATARGRRKVKYKKPFPKGGL